MGRKPAGQDKKLRDDASSDPRLQAWWKAPIHGGALAVDARSRSPSALSHLQSCVLSGTFGKAPQFRDSSSEPGQYLPFTTGPSSNQWHSADRRL